MCERGLFPVSPPPHVLHQVRPKQILACAVVFQLLLGVSPRSLYRVCVDSGHWIHEILRVVDRAMDVSTLTKGVVCPPQVSVDSRTTSDILLDYRDEGGRVSLRNGNQKDFVRPSLDATQHPVSVHVAAPVVLPSAKLCFINLNYNTGAA